jgi:lipopolysaccharide biosynthesis glycosyltransferase
MADLLLAHEEARFVSANPSANMKQEFQIALCTGLNRDLRYLAVLVRSIYEQFSEPEKLRFHLLHFQLTEDQLLPFHLSLEDIPCPVEFHRIDERVGRRVDEPGFGYWGRLWLMDVLPASIDRVLYLDSDMLCCADLRPLWETDIDECFAAVVQDPGTRVHGCEQSLAKSAAEFGFEPPAERSYFNSGMLFLNLPRCREIGLLKIVEETFRGHYNDLRFWDQDALNLIFREQVVYLSPEWNLVESIHLFEHWDFELYQEFPEPRQYFFPRLRHFSGKMKPDGPYARASEAELFYRYLDQTAWKGWRSKESSKWYRAIVGHLLDFHYVVVRGLKQRALPSPWSELFKVVQRAPYVLILYPLIPLYRLILKIQNRQNRND